MFAIELVLAAVIIGVLLYGTQRYLCHTITHRVAMAVTVLLFGYVAWNYFFINMEARAQTNDTLMVTMEVLLLLCMGALASPFRQDIANYEERQRMAADLPN